jgi:hypothetical protein
MDCGMFQENLVSWLEGLLGPGGSLLCQAHLEACAVCRDEYVAIVRLQRRLARCSRSKKENDQENHQDRHGELFFMTFSLKNTKTNQRTPIMTKGTKIGIVAAVVLAALIITPLIWLNHRKVNSVRPNQIAPQTLTPERSAQAKQTAKEFFEALGKADWNKVDKLCPPRFPLSAKLDDQTKSMLNGLEIVSLGDPFTKPGHAQVWVPYEIRFNNGESKKSDLSVRQDNPGQPWYFDGGL